MRLGTVVLWMLLFTAAPATAQVSVGIGFPGVSIGINLPMYPQLVRGAGLSGLLRAEPQLEFLLLRRHVLGLPGRQLVRQLLVQRPVGTRGPDGRAAVTSCASPCATTGSLRVLPRVASRMRRPAGASTGAVGGSRTTAGGTSGIAVPLQRPPRCLSYQRQYAGDRYPQAEQQHVLRSQNYRYQPRDVLVREHYKQQGSLPSSRPSSSQGAAPHQQQMPRSQVPGKNPKAEKPKQGKNADKREQQDQGSRT